MGKVRASIEQFGWTRPIVANTHPRCKGEIIVGHTARLAALEMGLTHVPVRWVKMPPAKAHAAAVADNKLGEISTWDADLLAELHKAGAISANDFAVAGFSDDELAKLGTPPELPSTAFASTSTDRETHYECPKCHHKWRAKSKAVNGKPEKQGKKPKAA